MLSSRGPSRPSSAAAAITPLLFLIITILLLLDSSSSRVGVATVVAFRSAVGGVKGVVGYGHGPTATATTSLGGVAAGRRGGGGGGVGGGALLRPFPTTDRDRRRRRRRVVLRGRGRDDGSSCSDDDGDGDGVDGIGIGDDDRTTGTGTGRGTGGGRHPSGGGRRSRRSWNAVRGGRTLTAREALRPDLYLSPIDSPSTPPLLNSTTTTGDCGPLPLSAGLRTLIRTLEGMLREDEDDDDARGQGELLLDHLVRDGAGACSVLRIEQPVSSPRSVDPLCWLHAQRVGLDELRSSSSARRNRRGRDGVGDGEYNGKNDDGTLPVLYFADAEGESESVAIGKASPMSFSDAWDPFSDARRIWDVDGREREGTGGTGQGSGGGGATMFTEGELPPGARVYGGSRFDWERYRDGMSRRGGRRRMEETGGGDAINGDDGDDVDDDDDDGVDDWDGFGGERGGYWILPAVELRRETIAAPSSSSGGAGGHEERAVTLSVHLHNLSGGDGGDGGRAASRTREGWRDAASHVLAVLRRLNDRTSPSAPCTMLPPVITRSEGNDDQYAFERGVTEALGRIRRGAGEDGGDGDGDGDGDDGGPLRKVVLARKVDLNLGSTVCGLDVLMRMKFGGHIGHLFYLNPGDDGNVGGGRTATRGGGGAAMIRSREFLGCTPERLFRVGGPGRDRLVSSEALAGTRLRGSTPDADNELLRELLSSEKDVLENEITGQFIRGALRELEENGWLEKSGEGGGVPTSSPRDDDGGRGGGEGVGHGQQRYFVRRLRNLQSLHPTPAVCGDGPSAALDFIRQYEAAGFDRGYFAGPFGYISRDSADIVVAIRSALVTNYDNGASNMGAPLRQYERDSESNGVNGDLPPESKVSVFGGAGVVDGSTVQGEWSEISHKMGVMSSLFPPSPITLQSQSTPNVAWSTAFVEELVRSGVTQFYVCPGSRNTPLTAAIYKSMRSNVGIVRAISVHDERGAGFRAIGYARANGRPAAVVTSSGTAVANLYPSVVEASSDGVPLIVLTADRPYENRDTGSNQSIDQVKIFSASYVRWFRDILPPSDDVPVSLALSDANHAVSLSKQLMGPVHLNVQFRENLAPDDGAIRNDNRIGSTTKFHNMRFTDVPGFSRWSRSGSPWQNTFYPNINIDHSVHEVAELILKSRRGIIVTGNLRGTQLHGHGTDLLSSTIAHFAQYTGIPIFGGIQSGALRREYPVIPYSEHLMKNPLVSKGMQPDLILQLGAPLISTEISQVFKSNPSAKHVLVHPFYPTERADPDQTITHMISSDIAPFLNAMIDHFDNNVGCDGGIYGSELAPLLFLGRELQKKLPSIIQDSISDLDLASSPKASDPEVNGGATLEDDAITLTEPQVMLAIADVLSETSGKNPPMSIFLSNSMPVRDGEFFLYPSAEHAFRFPSAVSVNRGASGIDGIVSTAVGCSEASKRTTLICGDVTTLHDLNGFYGLTNDETPLNSLPLTTVIVNNGGGAIFSFLPISKHGQDVGFDEFWGTPTKNFSFRKGVSAFGLPYQSASSYEALKDAYRSSIQSGGPAVIEAKVAGRATNVDIHQRITLGARNVIDSVLGPRPSRDRVLPIKWYHDEDIDMLQTAPKKKKKTLLMLHGWMGDKSEWDVVGETLRSDHLSQEWSIVSIDLPGHGQSALVFSSDQQVAHSSLGLDAMKPFDPTQQSPFSLAMIARAVSHSLVEDHNIKHLDAIAGYSLGGRVALAMKRLYSNTFSHMDDESTQSALITDQTRMILLGSSPGKLPNAAKLGRDSDMNRLLKDFSHSESLFSSAYRSYTKPDQDKENLTRFLTKWYGQPLWGNLRQRQPKKYQDMVGRRLNHLLKRRRDVATVLYECSPPRTAQDNWKAVNPSRTLFIAGELDETYSTVGRAWQEMRGIAKYIEVAGAGHALLVEEPRKISSIISNFVNDETIEDENALNITPIPNESPFQEVEDNPKVPTQLHQLGVLEYDAFSITVRSKDGLENGVQGIGWGENARLGSEMKRREGFIVSLTSRDGTAVGVGEVSPLNGLHGESLEDAELQLQLMKQYLMSYSAERPEFDAVKVLSLDGCLTRFIDRMFGLSGIDGRTVAPSVRSGLEMAMLSLSSQLHGQMLPQALSSHFWKKPLSSQRRSFGQLPINGLVTRGENTETFNRRKISFQSLKVKVGHKDSNEDAQHLIKLKETLQNGQNLKLRADANRAWDMDSALTFVNELKTGGSSAFDAMEFIEEPIATQTVNGGWSFEKQIDALEVFAHSSSLSYALDESLADLAVQHDYKYEKISVDLREAFGAENMERSGCVAFVLKPALLGVELSMQLAKLAQKEFHINAVFSSSFDSGIGLAYTAILAATAENSPYSNGLTTYSHGLGTFDMLGGDTLSPSFESYVNNDGLLNIPSLSRSLYGLSLDEMSDRLPTFETSSTTDGITTTSTESDTYLATTSTTSGRDITVSVSLPLPFSDGIASSRFTDLPQMSRWSPWLNSVTYLDESPGLTEWNLNIRGVKFSWKAQSEVLQSPKGIRWESISGLKNKGMVEFEPTSVDSCMMRLKMSIIMPYILVSLFQGMPSVVQEFLQNKLLKWSLEMFRDVVKADLALERGDQELGDALFGAVEGRANALEEALNPNQ